MTCSKNESVDDKHKTSNNIQHSDRSCSLIAVNIDTHLNRVRDNSPKHIGKQHPRTSHSAIPPIHKVIIKLWSGHSLLHHTRLAHACTILLLHEQINDITRGKRLGLHRRDNPIAALVRNLTQGRHEHSTHGSNALT